MTGPKRPGAAAQDGAKTDAEDRADRLAAALRANLHRRKDQKRARKAAPAAPPDPDLDAPDPDAPAT